MKKKERICLPALPPKQINRKNNTWQIPWKGEKEKEDCESEWSWSFMLYNNLYYRRRASSYIMHVFYLWKINKLIYNKFNIHGHGSTYTCFLVCLLNGRQRQVCLDYLEEHQILRGYLDKNYYKFICQPMKIKRKNNRYINIIWAWNTQVWIYIKQSIK